MTFWEKVSVPIIMSLIACAFLILYSKAIIIKDGAYFRCKNNKSFFVVQLVKPIFLKDWLHSPVYNINGMELNLKKDCEYLEEINGAY